MKKTTALFLSILISFTLTGCGLGDLLSYDRDSGTSRSSSSEVTANDSESQSTITSEDSTVESVNQEQYDELLATVEEQKRTIEEQQTTIDELQSDINKQKQFIASTEEDKAVEVSEVSEVVGLQVQALYNKQTVPIRVETEETKYNTSGNPVVLPYKKGDGRKRDVCFIIAGSTVSKVISVNQKLEDQEELDFSQIGDVFHFHYYMDGIGIYQFKVITNIRTFYFSVEYPDANKLPDK